ncbi:MAG: early E1A protein [Lachnospiraceae bacterium]|nr:early E1A protein [Lachnospiraceae bacterium]
MLAKGNGKPAQCVKNLISMTRGECPYDRIRGLSNEFDEQPISIAKAMLKADIQWVVSTYEPRASIDDAELVNMVEESGAFKILINATVSGGTVGE